MFQLSKALGLGMRNELSRASYGRRFLALWIDWLIALFSSGLLIPIYSSSLSSTLTRFVIFLFEVSLVTSLGGGSIGQRLLKLRVLSWPDYLFVKPGYISIRTLLILLVVPTFFTDANGRGLHDRIAKTVVMKLS
mgnify:CR=1 FL=1